MIFRYIYYKYFLFVSFIKSIVKRNKNWIERKVSFTLQTRISCLSFLILIFWKKKFDSCNKSRIILDQFSRRNTKIFLTFRQSVQSPLPFQNSNARVELLQPFRVPITLPLINQRNQFQTLGRAFLSNNPNPPVHSCRSFFHFETSYTEARFAQTRN